MRPFAHLRDDCVGSQPFLPVSVHLFALQLTLIFEKSIPILHRELAIDPQVLVKRLDPLGVKNFCDLTNEKDQWKFQSFLRPLVHSLPVSL